jgi:thiol-disulfide isomerase/thioredoxin
MTKTSRILWAAAAFVGALLVADEITTAGGPETRLRDVGPQELGAALRPTGGHPLLVHVWAGWCAPCVAEWPQLAGTLRRLDPRVDVLTVALDEGEDAPSPARVLARLGAVRGRHLVASPTGAARPLSTVDPSWDGSVPTTLLLDPQGRVVLAQRGLTRLDVLEAQVGSLVTP